MAQIPVERAGEAGRKGWRPWYNGPAETRSWLEALFGAAKEPRNPNITPAPEDADTKWAAIRALLAENNAQNYEGLPENVRENPKNRQIWNSVTGTYMTPAEWIDFKTVAGPEIRAGRPFDPEGTMQLRSTPGNPEVFMRPIPDDPAGESDQYGKSSQRAMDENYRTRIMALMR